MVPLSPFNDTLVMVAEWVGDTGLLAVSGDEILYMVGCELKVLPLSFKIENERQTKQYTFFCLLCYCYWYHVDPLFCSGLFTARSKSFDSTIYLIRTRLREWGNSRKFLVYTNFLIQIENHRILVVETSTIFYVWFYPNQADLEFAILSIKTPITLRSISLSVQIFDENAFYFICEAGHWIPLHPAADREGAGQCHKQGVSRWAEKLGIIKRAQNWFLIPETILEGDSSLWLSQDHSRVAYLSFHYPDLNHDEDNDPDDHHPEDLDPDVVNLNVVQLSDLKSWNVSLSESFTSTKDVCVGTCQVAGVTWLTRDNILVTWLDIDKQTMIITSCSLEQASCKLVKVY